MLSTIEFKALTKEGQDEYLYFLQRFHEVSNELQGMEMGVRTIAGYKVELEEGSAMDRLRARKVWIEKELQSWEAYQELLEDKERYQMRVEKIISSVREG